MHPLAAVGRSRRLSEDPLKRTTIACDRCRGRKTKCLGVAPYPCMTCEKSGAECVYPKVPKRIYVSEEEWNNLQAKVDSLTPAATASATDHGDFSNTHQAGQTEIEPAFQQGLVIVVTTSGKYQFLGPASSDFLATQLDSAHEATAALDSSPFHRTDLPLRRKQDLTLPGLPPLTTARRWYAAQFAYIGSIFNFIQPKYFESRLTKVYGRSPNTSSREDCLLYCQILLILAFGQMYSLNAWATDDGPPGFSYFQAAMSLLPDIHEEGSLLFVEVLGLVAYFMQILNRRDAAFLYMGLAVRMAVSLGLHQEVRNSHMDEVELEHRRRVWWSTYSMDRILCIKSGNPISIHDQDIDVEMPSPLPLLDLDEAQALILAHYTQLSRILGKIGQNIYRKQHDSGNMLLASVQDIMKDLEQWWTDMPAQLSLDFQNLGQHLSREAISAFLHYYQCVNMTGRPVLFRVFQKRLKALSSGSASMDWQQGLSTSIVHIVRKSIAGAVQATLVMEAALRCDMLATYGFMDGEHAFSAALVLVMANVAFPYNDRHARSMTSAMSILETMADKGNEYIRARHELLVKLQSTMSEQVAEAAMEHDGTPMDTNMATTVHTDFGNDAIIAPEMSRLNFEPFEDLSFSLNASESDDKFFDEFINNGSTDISSTWASSFQQP